MFSTIRLGVTLALSSETTLAPPLHDVFSAWLLEPEILGQIMGPEPLESFFVQIFWDKTPGDISGYMF